MSLEANLSFPELSGGRTEGFSFKGEFGRREGKKISRDLYAMLNYNPVIGEADLSFVIPSSLAIFGKHIYGKKAEKSAKESLSKIIESFFDPMEPKDIAIDPEIHLIRAGGKLALYELAFGTLPIPEDHRKKIKSKTKQSISSNLSKGGSLIQAAIGAERYLSLGGEAFWPEETTEIMLRELHQTIFTLWEMYKALGLFRPNFATAVLAYKVLRNST